MHLIREEFTPVYTCLRLINYGPFRIIAPDPAYWSWIQIEFSPHWSRLFFVRVLCVAGPSRRVGWLFWKSVFFLPPRAVFSFCPSCDRLFLSFCLFRVGPASAGDVCVKHLNRCKTSSHTARGGRTVWQSSTNEDTAFPW